MTMKDLGFYRGIDLGGWFSQCDYSDARLDGFITEKDLDRIASWGLDHVRIPVDYNVMETSDGKPVEKGYARIGRALGWCKERGLKVVLDLHKTYGYSFDSGEKEAGFFDNPASQERFCRLWEKMAARFCDPENVAFELLNEVTDKDFITVWNRVARECIARIRVFAPKSLILVGSYWNNSAEAVKDLDPPADELVIYNFHCYSPLKFTHQGASWVPELYNDTRITFAEAEYTAADFEKEFASALEHAEKNGTSLYCGEYGVIDLVPPEETVKWYREIHSVFEKHGIGRAAWSYKDMNFGIGDPRMDGVRDELLRYL